MHRNIIILIVILLSGPAHAGENSLFPSSRFKFGYQAMHIYYDEPGVMNEKGFLHGGFGSWEGYFTRHRLMASFEAEGGKGGLDYTGRYSDGTKLELETNDSFVSLRAALGMGFGFGRIGITPYTGIAWRYWYDRLNAKGGYERKIRQFYLPLGMNLIFRRNDHWSMGGRLEGDLLISGLVKSKLSQAGPDYGDAKNRQDFMTGWGGRVSVFMEYKHRSWIIGLEPYFRYWNFKNSETDNIPYGGVYRNVLEPKNNFYISGIRLYLKF